MRLTPRPLTDETFAPYGRILEAKADRFQVVASDAEAKGWQVGLNRAVDREHPSVHRHLNTDEIFAPSAGHAVLVLAPPDRPDEVEAFDLDRPLLVRAGVWHTTLVPGDPALVLLAETLDPVSEDHPLPEPVRV